jgi:hypothetical protein
LGLEAQTTAKKVRLNPIYHMRGGVGGTVDGFGRFESQIQQRSDFFLSGLAAEPTDQPDMSDQKSGTPLNSLIRDFKILGCPGSGCTTFLKAISNEREGYASVSGEVCYAGMDAQEMAKHYKGEVVYNNEGIFQIH